MCSGGQGVTHRAARHQGRSPIPAARPFDLEAKSWSSPISSPSPRKLKPYTMFQHAGIKFIYMLTGKVLYRHADKAYPLGPGGRAVLRCGGAAWA